MPDQGALQPPATSRSARSAGLATARRMFAAHLEADRRKAPVDEVLGAADDRRSQARFGQAGGGAFTRRAFLLGGATVAASISVGSRREPAGAAAAAAPRIAIVGAGLAGLRCAHLLWTQQPERRIATTVYEAHPERIGGRCWTLRGFFDNGLTTEHGGSFINSNQLPIRRLAAQLGLREEVVNGGDLPAGQEIFWFDGGYYTYAEANADWGGVGFPAFRAALHEARTGVGRRRLDALSVPEWLDETPIGASSRFGRLMMANTVSENGGDPSDQSALDLIQLTGFNPRDSLYPIPGDDEKYHIVGGNDQLVTRMAAQLPPAAVRHGHALVAVRQSSGGTVTLTFDVANRDRLVDVQADFVVLALPFSTLRHVDLSKSGLSPSKSRVIQTLGMGSNAKIHVELDKKTWPRLGFSGATYTDWEHFCVAWDDCVQLGPAASPALLLGFPGGVVGRSRLTGGAHGASPAKDVAWFLDQIEPIFPGTRKAYTGRAYEDHWALDPWVQGAYSYYRVGQAARFGAIAAAPEGRYVFAGEHTSIGNQGFLDGAVATGERAAVEILYRTGVLTAPSSLSRPH